jgi:hypothetical protein
VINTADPFAAPSTRAGNIMPEAADDYDILQYELDEVYDRPAAEAERTNDPPSYNPGLCRWRSRSSLAQSV